VIPQKSSPASQDLTQSSRDAAPQHKLGYTRAEAALALGISANSLDRLAARGLIRPSRALRRPLYSLQELNRFLVETM